MSKKTEKHILTMARLVKVKKASTLEMTLKKINKVVSKNKKLKKKLIEHCTKYFKRKAPMKWSIILKKHKASLKLKRVKRKRRVPTVKRNYKAMSYETHGKKGPRKSPKYTRKSKFGMKRSGIRSIRFGMKRSGIRNASFKRSRIRNASFGRQNGARNVRFGRQNGARNASFGTYWDSTQNTYAAGCDSKQCSSLNFNQYPYVGSFPPYARPGNQGA